MVPSLFVLRVLLGMFGWGIAGDRAELVVCPEELPPGMERSMIAVRAIDPSEPSAF